MLKSGLPIAAFVLMATSAVAQDQAAKPTTPEAAKPDPNGTVTVTGTKPQTQNKIDRRVHDVKDDPQAKTGTAADVLNNVPSVNVDSDGNVSLRGQGNVQVLLNGKATSQLQGDARAATLQSMSADDIDSVEVITNPSAQFRADGAGGIINIVTKRNRKPGKTGALITNYGSNGRYNASLSGSVNTGKWVASGNVSVRKDGRTFRSQSDLQRLGPTGTVLSTSRDDMRGSGHRDSVSGQGTLEFNPDEATTLSLNGSVASRNTGGSALDHLINNAASGAPLSDYVRTTLSNGTQKDAQGRLTYDHRGPKGGESLKIEMRASTTHTNRTQNDDSAFSFPVQPDLVDQILTRNQTDLAVLAIDSVEPIGDTQLLSTGLDIESQKDSFDNRQTPNSGFSNLFRVSQGFSAAYATYQMPLGKWTGLFGLRYEDVNLGLNQVTSAQFSRNHYDRLMPSLHLSYPLSDKSKMKFSYSHRMQRPGANDLNPFVIYRDAQNVSTGNPNLKPQEVHSLEANYEYTTLPLSYTAGLYYRRSYNTITDSSVFISPTVLETTKINSGSGQSGGFEYSLNMKPSKAISWAFSTNVFYAQLQVPGLSGLITRSNVSYNGKTSFDFRPNTADRYQISANFQGPVINAQGTRSGNAIASIAYGHKFNPQLSLIVTGQDVFQSMKFDTTINSAFINGRTHRQIQGQVFFVGLSYTFGGAGSKRDDTLIPDRPRGMGEGRGGYGGGSPFGG